MANEVIKVYNTEANALANGTAGRIDPVTLGSDKVIGNSEAHAATSGDNAGPYYVYHKYFYRFEANEPVLEFHIDWDDGESNSPDKANIEIVKLETPSFSCVVPHVYTTHAAYFPLIRVKSVEGFLSKWYTGASSSVSGDLEPISLPTGQNDYSVVSKEKSSSGRINSFYPSMLPSVAVLKVDKKRIYSSIDNDTIAGMTYPLFYAFSRSSASPLPDVKITMKAKGGGTATTLGATRVHTLAGTKIFNATTFNATWTHSGTSSLLYLNCIPANNNSAATSVSAAGPILRIELDNAKELADTDRIFVNVFDAGSGLDDGPGGFDTATPTDRTVAILSNGNPIVELNDPYSQVRFDCTETRARSPKSMGDDVTHGWYIDQNKLHNHPDGGQFFDGHGVNGRSIGTDRFTKTDSSERLIDGAKDYNYTHTFAEHVLDSDSRMLPITRMPRVQVSTTRGSGFTYDDMDNSRIESWDYTTVIPTGAVEDEGTNIISYDNHPWENDSPITYNSAGDTAMGGLTNGTLYYVKDSTTHNFKLSTTSGGSAVTISGTGNSKQYFSSSHKAGIPSNPIPTNLGHQDLLLFGQYTNSARTTLNWYNLAAHNAKYNLDIIGSGGVADVVTGSAGAHPLNYILIAKTEKFDRLHFRFDNTYAGVANDTPTVEISAFYSPHATSSDGWKPLEVRDTTYGFKTSGTIKFTPPPDWFAVQSSSMNSAQGPVGNDYVTTTGSEAPADLWDFSGYAILIAFNVVGGDSTKFHLKSIFPYNNSHSQVIQVVDPHYVSLNSIAIAQSISFGRNSKVISVEDRLGRADIRKIGASGGNITFGGIDLGGSADDRKTLVGYQKNATPVFLDITHRSDEITRFFGVITQLTEDHPAGKMFPKWAVSMQISHIIEMSSTGAISSDKISIGGALLDDRKYLL